MLFYCYSPQGAQSLRHLPDEYWALWHDSPERNHLFLPGGARILHDGDLPSMLLGTAQVWYHPLAQMGKGPAKLWKGVLTYNFHEGRILLQKDTAQDTVGEVPSCQLEHQGTGQSAFLG